MFRCLDCGREFETPARWEENRGECFGYPAYEKMTGCPYCEGGYEEIPENEESEEEKDDECDGD